MGLNDIISLSWKIGFIIDILGELESYIQDYNSCYNKDYKIDSIRITYSKSYKQEQLNDIGKWNKINKNSNILKQLKKYVPDLTYAYRLKTELQTEKIFFYNLKDPPKYRKAIMIIFGLSQYKKKIPSKLLVHRILDIMKDVTEIDICLDYDKRPNYNELQKHFKLKRLYGDNTVYINEPSILMIKKIIIYNKAFKDKLKNPLWRLEATIEIPNINELAIPMRDIDMISSIIW